MREKLSKALRTHTATLVAGVVVLVVLVAACVVARPFIGAGKERLVVIHDANGETHTLSLATDGQIEVTTSLGTNLIVVEDGAARITQADCPHKSCMQQKAIRMPGEQLICLPHKLWVEVVTADGPGQGALDEDAVTWSEPKDVDMVSR